jgi:hypothetical protein
MLFKNSFGTACLESEELQRLFYETTSYVQNIGIEVVATGRGHWSREEHPAATMGLTNQNPTILIVDSLDREQRIEAIAHELVHLLLVYRYGLGVIGRRIPRRGDSEDVFRFFMSMRGDWVYLLGQIANTVHHLILRDYLRKEYGIGSRLHLNLLHHNFQIIGNDNSEDKESLYARGLIAFEYETLIGKVDTVMNAYDQTGSFWKAFHLAQKYFGSYGLQSIPTASSFEEDTLSFLEALGYQRENFVFFPERK